MIQIKLGTSARRNRLRMGKTDKATETEKPHKPSRVEKLREIIAVDIEELREIIRKLRQRLLH